MIDDQILPYPLPCPFCGEIIEISRRVDLGGIVYCVGCKCELMPYTNWYRESLDAVTVWNKRLEPKARPKTVQLILLSDEHGGIEK